MHAGAAAAHLAAVVFQPAACLQGEQLHSSTPAAQMVLLQAAGLSLWLHLQHAAVSPAGPGGAVRRGPVRLAVGGLLHGCGGLAPTELLLQQTALPL
jgi:hypothetical protein